MKAGTWQGSPEHLQMNLCSGPDEEGSPEQGGTQEWGTQEFV